MIRCLQSARSASAQALFVLASLAFVLRAVVPVGFMVDRDSASGGLEVTICTAHSAQDAVIDEAILQALGGPPAKAGGAERPGDSSPSKGGQDCPFAFVFAAALSHPLLALLAPSDRAGVEVLPAFTEALTRFSARPPLPARGPPTLL